MISGRDCSMIRSKVIQQLQRDNAVHSPSAAAKKLMELVNQDVDLSDIAHVVNMEPGLAAKILRLASSVMFGGKSMQSVEEALSRVGTAELRKLAMALGVIDSVAHLRVKVDWNMFWLHNLLTARLTEILAGTYRQTDGGGKEYLAGLLHDIGKLFLEHYFPREFESIMLRSMERGCGMYAAEQQLYDITHAEVGALLCEKWGLHREIVRGVRFHHEPNSPFNKDPNQPEQERLLATCICITDSLANMCKANIQGAQRFQEIQVESLTEWKLLQNYAPLQSLDLNLEGEIEAAKQAIEAFQLEKSS